MRAKQSATVVGATPRQPAGLRQGTRPACTGRPFREATFNAIAVPAMLLSVVGSLVLGVGQLRRRMRPLAAGVRLVAFGPRFFVISDPVAGAGHSNSE